MEVICTSRLLDSIGSTEEWQRQSGYSMENAAIGACKELLDNSLDACEETGIPPVVSVTLDDTGLSIQDKAIAAGCIKCELDRARSIWLRRCEERRIHDEDVLAAFAAAEQAEATLRDMQTFLRSFDRNITISALIAKNQNHESAIRLQVLVGSWHRHYVVGQSRPVQRNRRAQAQSD